MLSYVFWHRKAPRTTQEKYEERLLAFRKNLASLAPKSFLGSRVQSKGRTVMDDSDTVYENWYPISRSEALIR
ncbi:hypothetical protein B9Q04_04610 [Candidatus Marsarchaeota G2 archaeon BE_D]|uniref:Uncharacterized protein n=1 Tax=Candidatus Marsarchaeota G2 archaeon BE_D TaxID=1978158 RepID=A0A2R6CCL3_9ARCH|nr:MAG: hypothetical protein B9Q04_04610 [Candidatus Marsarchaeota G2 archaeon BE_D]